jgi:hypothetical protein
MWSKIREARLTRGLRQTDVASLTFGTIRQHRLSEIERWMPCTQREAAELSAIFGLSIQDLGIQVFPERQVGDAN